MIHAGRCGRLQAVQRPAVPAEAGAVTQTAAGAPTKATAPDLLYVFKLLAYVERVLQIFLYKGRRVPAAGEMEASRQPGGEVA